MARPNIFEGEFPMSREDRGIRGKPVARPAGARELGATLYELAAGSPGMDLHGHYGNEELFVVLDGFPTLRTSDGEEQLGKGDVVACVRGRDGIHTIENRSSEPVLVLAISTANRPDVVVYPENDTVGVATRNPFVPPAEGEDEGVVGLFRAQDNLRKPAG